MSRSAKPSCSGNVTGESSDQSPEYTRNLKVQSSATNSCFQDVASPSTASGVKRPEHTKALASLEFFRTRLAVEYEAASRQADFNYVLWASLIIISIGLLMAGIVLLLRNQIAIGTITTVATLLPSFINRSFRSRESQSRELVMAKYAHLEYGNRCLLVIVAIDLVEDPVERARCQSRLVNILTDNLAGSHTDQSELCEILAHKRGFSGLRSFANRESQRDLGALKLESHQS